MTDKAAIVRGTFSHAYNTKWNEFDTITNRAVSSCVWNCLPRCLNGQGQDRGIQRSNSEATEARSLVLMLMRGDELLVTIANVESETGRTGD